MTDTEFNGEKYIFSIEIDCSKGTYIRTLAVQIGELLGYPAHMSSLSSNSFWEFYKGTMPNIIMKYNNAS